MPLTIDLALALARAAADDQPSLVVLVFDDFGAVLAVRPNDLAPAKVAESCSTLLGFLGKKGRGPAVVVSVTADAVDTAAFVAAWPEVASAFSAKEAKLLDWLVVSGSDSHVSIAAIAGEQQP